jgi:hypothetical protein
VRSVHAKVSLVFGMMAVACSPSGNSEPAAGVTITGRVAASTPAMGATRSPLAAGLAGSADRLVAFPIQNGLILPGGIQTMQSVAIAAGGTFSITLGDLSDWMLVLVDSRVTGPGQFMGYVAATVGPGNTLLALPTSRSSGGTTIALGQVTPNASGPDGDTYASETTVSSSDFALTPEALSTIAQADNALKNLKNLLVNTQGTTFSALTPQFGFKGVSVAENVFPDPSAYAIESFYKLQVETNHPAISVDLLCGAAPPTVALADPVGIAIDSTGAACAGTSPTRTASNARFFLGEKTDPGPYGSHASMVFGAYAGAIPAGGWTLTAGGTAAAVFDAAVASPDGGAGRPTGIVPVVRATTDGSHRVTSFDVKWYAPNVAGGFAAITDSAVFTHLLRAVDFSVFGPAGSENRMLDPSVTSTVVPTQNWYVSGGEAALHADSVSVSVANGGVGRAFMASFQ